MKQIKDSINVGVINNTPFVQNINLLGGSFSPNAVPPKNLYQWDLSSETYYGSVVASIIISNTSNPTPVKQIVQVDGYNIQSVAFALNTLNMGFFQISGNIIYVSSDYYIYGILQIGSSFFTSTWNTNNLSGGSSASNQIKLPLIASGLYNFTVEWGDGSIDTITSWNQPETTHTYSAVGTYSISISGTCNGWAFNNTGDRLKITSILSWGSLYLSNSIGAFYGCSNLVLNSVADVLNTTGINSFFRFFQSCTSITTINNINLWDTSAVSNMGAVFQNASSFNGNISSWDVSSVTGMSFMFAGASLFNQNIGSWNTSLTQSFDNMFLTATSFNQDISSWDLSSALSTNNMFNGATSFNQNIASWNVSSVINMGGMFRNATSFNQDISSWDVSSVANFNLFMAGKTFLNYSSTYLDAIYNGWSLLSLQPNVTISFGTIKYTASGVAGKLILTSAPNNWTITDGGI